MAMQVPRSRQKFPHAEDVMPLSEADAACFDELREVLKRHDALDRFGVWLLHQHFDIADDEVLIEETDGAQRKTVIRPIKAAAAQGKTVLQTAWTLGPTRADLGYVIDYAKVTGGHTNRHVNQ